MPNNNELVEIMKELVFVLQEVLHNHKEGFEKIFSCFEIMDRKIDTLEKMLSKKGGAESEQKIGVMCEYARFGDSKIPHDGAEINKIKAIRPHIIVTGTVEKPYYEILYYDTSDNAWHIGYSSYNLANVLKWKEELFEVVGEIEDMKPAVEMVRCKDCIYWEKGKDYTPYCNHIGNMMTDTTEEDYCSMGERRTDDD